LIPFSSLAATRETIIAWKEGYNRNRLHTSLSTITPHEFAMKASLEKQAACGQKPTDRFFKSLKENCISGHNLSPDSKLRACDLPSLEVADVRSDGDVRNRTTIINKKTGNPVPFETMDQSRSAIADWCEFKRLEQQDWLVPSRKDCNRHLSTRQYARLVDHRVQSISLRRSGC
jgi:hypothetical protein